MATTSKTPSAKTKKTASSKARTASKKKRAPAKKNVSALKAKSPAQASAFASAKTKNKGVGAFALQPEGFMNPQDFMKEMEIIMTKQPFQFDKLAQDAANSGREGFEALVKAGTIFTKGFEEIVKTASSLTQSAAEKQAEYAKELMSSKTLNEYAEAQNKIAQASFDQFMSDATKLSEMSVKVLTESAEPLNTQINAAMQKANKAMAA